MMRLHFWSGGKDSTAGIILNHINNLPPLTVIFCEVMFDRNRSISGELPEHIEFIYEKAIPIFQSWGYETKILRADKDYLDLFFHIVTKSKIAERNGKYGGWLIGGRCAANRDLKIKPIKDFCKGINDEYVEYIGIACDEPKRIARLTEGKESLLVRCGYTEKMAYELCKKYGLLSPIYELSHRGGCWFCPNQPYNDFALLKQNHPELWNKLKELSHTPDLISRGFRYGVPFEEVENRIDKIIDKMKISRDIFC